MYESSPWKEDLKRRRQLLLQYNTKEHFEKMKIKRILLSKKRFSIRHSSFGNYWIVTEK